MRTLLRSIMFVGLISSCATTPKELVDARQAYEHANGGSTRHFAPEEMRQAKRALDEAERAYANNPKSYHTRDLAYAAQRKAQLAEVKGGMAGARKNNQQAINEYERTQGDIITQSKVDLGKSKLELSQMQAQLAKLAAVKEEQRGLVITLSGSVLFPSNKAVLLPSAQNRLNQVAGTLMANKQRKIIVEGHTDSRGKPDYNMELSQRRAEAVRAQLISQGYPAELIEARGMGDQRPVAGNASAEDRAINRRVEIVVLPEVSENARSAGSDASI